MTQQEQDFVSRCGAAAKSFLDLREFLSEMDVMYYGVGDFINSITQEELNSIPSFGGLTKEQLNDGVYALKQQLLTMNDGFTALILMKSAQ